MKSVIVTGLFLSTCAFAQPPQFKVQDLGALPNLPDCTATAISQTGYVVGYCVPNLNYTLLGLSASPPVTPFLYTNGTMQNLNLTAFQTPVPTAVNDSGVVAGAYLSIGLTEGLSVSTFVAQNGTSRVLQGTLQALVPFGLNNSGQLIGSRFNVTRAFDFFLNSQALLTSVT